MNIQKILILIIKVILLLAVILIFSYVNTKKHHIEKVEKMKKEKIKEGNDPPKKLSENDNLVDNLVKKTQKMLVFQSKQDNADVDRMEDYLDAVDRNDFIENPNTKETNNKETNKQETNKKKVIEGFETEEDRERDRQIQEEKERRGKKLKTMQNQECKYRGITIFKWIYWFFYTILYVFIWLGKAMYDLLDDKTKQKPKSFISTLFSPFSFIFYGLKKFGQFVIWILLKMKYVIFFIISTIGNILFVFFPDFVLEILAYFFSPFLVLWRSITRLAIFTPFGAFCWSD